MPEKIKIDVSVLQNFIAQYKATFAQHRFGDGDEIYKWKAVKCFQDNWDIDAPDFLPMLQAAFAQTANLLANANNFPKKMLEEFSKVAADEVRAMFRELFDENIDVQTRVEAFGNKAAKLRDIKPEVWKQDYQTPNAISTYLWLRYPEKYYIYKYSVIKDNAQKLCGVDVPTGKLDRMVFGFALYDALCAELVKDSELVALSKSSLTADCYPDDSLKTLTIDVGYFISKHEVENVVAPTDTNEKAYFGKNTILYGTPGTGKTYSTVQYAVAIIEEKPLSEIKAEPYDAVFVRYLKHAENGLIAFTTFHQSFGYEEFIEGIRPVVLEEGVAETKRNIEYEIRDGVFKAFCVKVQKANDALNGEVDNFAEAAQKLRDALDENESLTMPTIWSTLGKSITVRQSTDGSGWLVDISVPSRPRFYNYEQLHNVYQGKKGVPMGGHDNYRKAVVQYMKTNYGLKDYVPPQNSGGDENKSQNYVFIIDEINRGNISKIFGEMITLIEPSKRVGASEQRRAVLTYSRENFGVPDNIYIIGTMNTADRSIAMLDTALRRRFDFVEMKPKSSTLTDVVVDGIDVAEMLDTINKRLTVLLDREHTVGHSYFLPLRDNLTLEGLAAIFEKRLIPLLQEYFYDDYEKIQLVLGDNQKPDDSTRFIVKKTDAVKLFGNAGIDFPEYYEVNGDAFKRVDAYAYLR